MCAGDLQCTGDDWLNVEAVHRLVERTVSTKAASKKAPPEGGALVAPILARNSSFRANRPACSL